MLKKAEEWQAAMSLYGSDFPGVTMQPQLGDIRAIQADALRHAAELVSIARLGDRALDLRSIVARIQAEADKLTKP